MKNMLDRVEPQKAVVSQDRGLRQKYELWKFEKTYTVQKVLREL
jgi:hypothetical protein